MNDESEIVELKIASNADADEFLKRMLGDILNRKADGASEVSITVLGGVDISFKSDATKRNSRKIDITFTVSNSDELNLDMAQALGSLVFHLLESTGMSSFGYIVQ